MEEDILSTTLAYKISPKTSKRTSFQDELQAAIAARACKIDAEESYLYADDFDDDDDVDDALEQLLRKKKMAAFKAGKNKAVEFKTPVEDQKTVKQKRVSFLKSGRKSSPTPCGSLGLGNVERDETEAGANSNRSGSSHSSQSDRSGSKSVQFRLEEDASNSSRSPSPRPKSSESTEVRQEVVTSTVESQGELDGERPGSVTRGKVKERVTDSPKQGEKPVVEDKKGQTGLKKGAPVPKPRERNIRMSPRSGSPFREERPKPRPRQRAPGKGENAEEESAVGGEVSRPPTSSVSVPLSSADRASSTSSAGEMEAMRGRSPQRREDDCNISSQFSQYSSSEGQLSDSFSRSADALDGLPEYDKSDNKDEYSSTSFEVPQEDNENDLKSSSSGQSHMTEKLHDNNLRSQSQKRPKSAQELAAESRYLGSLKVLDDFASQMKSEPDMADSICATVYQEWCKTKQKAIKEKIKGKKLEEQLREEKKQQEEASRKLDAKASFAAWTEKKTVVIKEQLKEKKELTRKQQQEMDEKVEKKEMAKKVFEKWKTGQDESLKLKHRKQKQTEKQMKLKKIEEEEERKKNCVATMLTWSQVKEKHILAELRRKRREEKIKEEEERYMKEEKGKMALEMYEKWLKRKERQEKRERGQRKIRAVLRDEPPPPWSPPNKTIPFGR